MDDKQEMGIIPYYINKAFSFLFGKSWKTTFIGYLAAALIPIITWLQSGKMTMKEVIIAIAIALAGRFQKDADKTGN